jgi:pyridoxal 5'-phosphate synthase subunit Pdx1
VLTPADDQNHINKHAFKVPFVCGCRNLGEALRRISEGAAFIRTKGEAGTGNVVEAVRHQREVSAAVRRAASMNEEELYAYAKDIQAPFHLLKEVARVKRLPVVNFAAGGIATPADAALMMQLGCDGGARTPAPCPTGTTLTAWASVRRLGHLQLGRPGQARASDRAGRHALQQPEDARGGV